MTETTHVLTTEEYIKLWEECEKLKERHLRPEETKEETNEKIQCQL